jgi:hypothetical protein|tara:strand:- start:699 stop:1394 length:696 start_codon:yes stop_codon:yes gene_type:complete
MELTPDVWHPWTLKSENISFEGDTSRKIGSGELKIASELDINTGVGGQNNVSDLYHKDLGNISIKNMTSDDCRLGADSQEGSFKILNKLILLHTWSEKYMYNFWADKTYAIMSEYDDKKTDRLIHKIRRGEICKSKFLKLNEHLEKLKVFFNAKAKCKAFKSELYEIVFSDDMRNKSLIEMANDVARREAINKTLIIVHKNLGFQIIKNIDRIYCTRITQSKCRISVLGIK